MPHWSCSLKWGILTCSWTFLIFLANRTISYGVNVQLKSSTLSLAKSARSLWVIIDDQLSFAEHIAAICQSGRFTHYNAKKISTHLLEYAAQILVQALITSQLDYANLLLTGLLGAAAKRLQMIQNVTVCLVVKHLLLKAKISQTSCFPYVIDDEQATHPHPDIKEPLNEIRVKTEFFR